MAGAKKKSSRLRGSREHGRGKKGGRGAGLRGGRGNAGAHKHKRVTYEVKENPKTGWWGKNNIGFKRPQSVVSALETMNVADVDERAPQWIAGGQAREENGLVVVDLGSMNVDRLLGSGQVRRKLAITVPSAAPAAVKKVKAAGGTVTETDPRKPPAPAAKPGAKGAPAAPKGGGAPPAKAPKADKK